MSVDYKHQETGLARIIQDQYVHGLLWGMGAGKSRTVIKAIEALSYELDRPVKVLIVAPKSVCRGWLTQFSEHCTEQFAVAVLDTESVAQRVHRMENFYAPADINVLVLAYSTFSARQNKEAVLKAVKKMKPDLMVCDELHNLRGMSNTTRLMARIAQHVPRRLGLTATPMPNSPGDVYGQWAWLDPEVFTSPKTGKLLARGAWEDYFGVRGGFQGKQIVAWKNQEELHALVARKSSVVRTEECLDLPPTRTVVQRFALSPAERKAYDQMRDDLLAVVEDETVTAANKIVAMLRLRQVCAGFLPLEDGTVAEIGTTRHDLAVEMIEDILAGESRVVVFAWSRHELDRLERHLQVNSPWHAEVFTINGGTKPQHREDYLTAFGSADPKRMIMLAQISTLNEGVNSLVTASHAIYLSLTHNRAHHVQSLGRLDRPGQRKPVVYWVLAAENSVDTAILAANEGKAKLEEALLRSVKEGR